MNMHKKNPWALLDFIPLPQKMSRWTKYGLTSILVFVFILLCIPSGSSDNGYIDRMKQFSPVNKARELYKKDGPRAASEYVSFYQSLPGYQANQELNQIKAEAEQHRSSWTYMAAEFGRGLIGMDHHEDYSSLTSSIAAYVPYLSDARDILTHGKGLYEHWNKFQNNENINSLELGLDGVGLAASLWGLIPGIGHAGDPIKQSTGVLRKCVSLMSNGVKTYVMQVFNKAFKFISKSGILDIKMSDFGDLTKLVENKKGQFNEAMNLVAGSFKELQPLINLALDNWGAASAVLSTASTPEELKSYINIANRIDKNNEDILKFGGKAALQAASRLEKAGGFNINLLKSAMLYGDAGLEAVGNIPAEELLAPSPKAESSFGFWRLALLVIYVLFAALMIARIWRPEGISGNVNAQSGRS